jgi:hypothetical protein
MLPNANTVDIVYLISIEIFTVLSLIANITCAWIFSNGRFKAAIFRYLTISSIVDCAFVLSMAPMPLIHSTAYPTLDETYWLNLYKVVVLFYFSRSFGLLSSLINIKISIDRLHLIKSKYIVNNRTKLNSRNIRILTFIFVLISFGINLPKMFFVRIIDANDNNFTLLSNQTSDIVRKYDAVILHEPTCAMLSHFLAVYLTNIPTLFTFIVLNCVLILNVNKKLHVNHQTPKLPTENENYCTRKRTRKIKSKAIDRIIKNRSVQRNTTCLVFWSTVMNSMDQFVLILVNLFLIVNQQKSFYFNRPLTFAIHSSLLFSHSSNICLYYVYNTQFAICLKKIIWRRY